LAKKSLAFGHSAIYQTRPRPSGYAVLGARLTEFSSHLKNFPKNRAQPTIVAPGWLIFSPDTGILEANHTKEDHHMTYGKRIRQARENLRLTQEQLAEQLDVSRQAVSKWEADLSRPTREKLDRLSEILDIPSEAWAEIDAELAAANRPPDTSRPWKIAAAALAAVCAVLAVCLAAALWPKEVSVPEDPPPDQEDVQIVTWKSTVPRLRRTPPSPKIPLKCSPTPCPFLSAGTLTSATSPLGSMTRRWCPFWMMRPNCRKTNWQASCSETPQTTDRGMHGAI
jgi:transcriptional regulator with XRE-family HTH domain